MNETQAVNVKTSLASTTKLALAGGLVATGLLAAPLSQASASEVVDGKVIVDYGSDFDAKDYVVQDLEINIKTDVDTSQYGNQDVEYTYVNADGETVTDVLNVLVTPSNILAYDQYIKTGSDFDALADAVAVAFDENGERVDLTDSLEVSGSVDTDTPGEYELVYSFTDLDDHEIQKTVTITVGDNTESADILAAAQAEREADEEALADYAAEVAGDESEDEEPAVDEEVTLLNETLVMYAQYKEDGLLQIDRGERVQTPSNMDEFLYNLDTLGYTGSTSWLGSGSLGSHASGELYDIYSFLRALGAEVNVDVPAEDIVPPTVEDEDEVVDTPEVSDEDLEDAAPAEDEPDTNETETPEPGDTPTPTPEAPPAEDDADELPVEEVEVVPDNDDLDTTVEDIVDEEPKDVEAGVDVDNIVIEDADLPDSDDSNVVSDDQPTTQSGGTTDSDADAIDGVELTTGTYVIGQDLDAGRYTVTNPNEGDSGNFIVKSEAESLKYNEIVGDGDYAVPSVTVDLSDGDSLEIAGAKSLLFTSVGNAVDDGSVAEVERSTNDAADDEVNAEKQMLPDTGSDVPTGGIIAGFLGLIGSVFGIRKFFG